MSTKKLQIVTPIVTSVNGQTGDVTLDISGGGSGSDIFIIEMTTSTTFSKTFNEIKAAIQTKKSLIGIPTNGTIPLYGYYWTQDNFEFISLDSAISGAAMHWFAQKDINSTDEPMWTYEAVKVPDAATTESNSGAAYWNSTNKSWEIKDITSGSDTFYFEISDNNGNLISSKTFTEIKSAIESNKHILVQYISGLYQATVSYMSSSSNARLLLYAGEGWVELNISSDNTITSQISCIPNFDQATNSLSNSGLVYWNPNGTTWSIKPTYKAGNGISISDDGTISVTAAKIYSGISNAPSADLGENGDIYIQTEG